jgi:hypothetical protein
MMNSPNMILPMHSHFLGSCPMHHSGNPLHKRIGRGCIRRIASRPVAFQSQNASDSCVNLTHIVSDAIAAQQAEHSHVPASDMGISTASLGPSWDNVDNLYDLSTGSYPAAITSGSPELFAQLGLQEVSYHPSPWAVPKHYGSPFPHPKEIYKRTL